jgi:hypothetical protein
MSLYGIVVYVLLCTCSICLTQYVWLEIYVQFFISCLLIDPQLSDGRTLPPVEAAKIYDIFKKTQTVRRKKMTVYLIV